MKPNILLGILNPRELEEFQDCIKKINNDKVYIKYFAPENDAYYSLRLFFLNHPEYTHLTLVPDDVLFTQKNIDDLIWGIEKYNFPVITGYSNIDLTNNKEVYTISFEGQYMERAKRSYKHLTEKELQYYRKIKGRYLRVRWQGFSLTTIRRDVVKMIPFEDDALYNGQKYGQGCCLDTNFSYQCINKNVPMFCDTNVKILHLKQGAASLMTNFYAGAKHRTIIWEKEGKKQSWTMERWW